MSFYFLFICYGKYNTDLIALKVIMFMVIIIRKKIVYGEVKQKSCVWLTIYHVYENKKKNVK